MHKATNLQFQSQSESPHSFERIFSSRVALLRFPLLMLVIAIHARCPSLDLRMFGNSFFAKFPYTAIPFFFMISGTFLVLKLNVGETLDYRGMLKKKLFSLLLPYILWNVLFCLPHLILPLLAQSLSFLPAPKYEEMNAFLVFLRTFGLNGQPPIDVPLWFVRNLMVLFLLAPLLVALMRRLPVWVSLLLLIGLDIAPPIAGMSYFMLGILLGIRKPSLGWVDRGWVFWLISAPLLLFSYRWTNTWQLGGVSGNDFLWTLFCFDAALLFYAMGGWMQKWKIHAVMPLIFLSNGSFFVYCLHAPLTTTLARFFNANSFAARLPVVFYLLTIFVATVICYAIYIVLRKWVPLVFRILNGQRPA